jgi:hypothetical protein
MTLQALLNALDSYIEARHSHFHGDQILPKDFAGEAERARLWLRLWDAENLLVAAYMAHMKDKKPDA